MTGKCKKCGREGMVNKKGVCLRCAMAQHLEGPAEDKADGGKDD